MPGVGVPSVHASAEPVGARLPRLTGPELAPTLVRLHARGGWEWGTSCGRVSLSPALSRERYSEEKGRARVACPRCWVSGSSAVPGGVTAHGEGGKGVCFGLARLVGEGGGRVGGVGDIVGGVGGV